MANTPRSITPHGRSRVYGGGMTKARFHWQVIDPHTAVSWLTWREGDKDMHTGPVGMVRYAEVTFDALRAMPLSRLQPHIEGLPEISGMNAPSARDIEKAWKAKGTIPLSERPTMDFVAPGFGKLEGESADDFYWRVAEFYRNALVSSGEPVKNLAKAADVPRTTATRWVFEARKRGYLSPTTKGRRSG